ncbi:MAG TPA: hypothetical protein DIT10_12690 [Chryseobacterium sp.]|nr:hypothetical protein [Chryseobacterium sp.]
MYKKMLFGILFLIQFSFVNAKKDETYFKNYSYNQQIPKSIYFQTYKYWIKIDKQSNGKYLYQSGGIISDFPIDIDAPFTPTEMIIIDGELTYIDNCYYFNFKNKGYKYVVKTIDKYWSEYSLSVYNPKGEKILFEKGNSIITRY